MLTTADMGLAPASPAAVRTRYVRVLRAFYFGGAPVSAGALLEVPAPFAAELVATNKAAFSEPPAPAPEPETAEPDAPKPARRGRRSNES